MTTTSNANSRDWIQRLGTQNEAFRQEACLLIRAAIIAGKLSGNPTSQALWKVPGEIPGIVRLSDGIRSLGSDHKLEVFTRLQDYNESIVDEKCSRTRRESGYFEVVDVDVVLWSIYYQTADFQYQPYHSKDLDDVTKTRRVLLVHLDEEAFSGF